ncbi:acetate--CoA ligase [Methanolobus profundi]|uniref:Acetyl-coenzyme A synthetase n=1 Tax=Methanolobus profundi TaxID=487685 RepID=A0A1I4U8R8_9EURY|nr:acetate--CoA ligase [Methanolobus profundi]SFM85315.1 acetyl-coenzyme A synthetase [Methanolobus profundi]
MGERTGSKKDIDGFRPPEDFSENAVVNDPDIYRRAEEDPEGFWEENANNIYWYKKWDKVLEWEPPHSKWFLGGKLNACYNCLDANLDTRADKAALIWESEDGDIRQYTYQELLDEVCKLANVLKDSGIRKGDIVTIYLPMIPEVIISMLACARIGAPHSVVFAAFSGDSLATRISNANSRLLITCDGYARRGKVVEQKNKVDDGISSIELLERVIVVKNSDNDISMKEGRDVWWHDVMNGSDIVCEPEIMDSEDMLFLMYTSGTTGKPKGIVHTTGGYMVATNTTSRFVFDLKEDDIYWCTADAGWITGHSYIVYGPLSNGATLLTYEGAPDYPEKDRYWDIIERHKVTILYTAPTAIRTFMKWGTSWLKMHDISSLRLMGSVGEPINPEAWKWYHENVGMGKCPIVDTWWQTETGMIMISPLPGVTTTKPGSATMPFPGIKAAVLDEKGNETAPGEDGFLAILEPWPSMVRTVFGNEERFIETYWSKWDNRTYFAGDGAKRDDDGYFWIIGRVDDVIKVAGHRIGSAEFESIMVSHPSVAEAGVVGKEDELRGEVIYCYVTLKTGAEESEELKKELRGYADKNIGPFARPKQIIFSDDLPKTRSGKIMRRVLKAIANNKDPGDVTTLQDPAVVDMLTERTRELESE